jgi:hypothetical protein
VTFVGKADVLLRVGMAIGSEALTIRAETLCPPFLVCNARLIDPMIVLIPELEDTNFDDTSDVLLRSGVAMIDGGTKGGESGAIIVMYDSAGG